MGLLVGMSVAALLVCAVVALHLARELRRLRKDLDTVSAQLDARSGSIVEFASHVTHELKGPLTGIRGAAELLIEGRSDGMTDEQRDRFLRNIDADAERMERMVSRLLDLARAGNPLPESVQEIDVRAFFDELGSRYDDDVEIVLEAPPKQVDFNRVQLQALVTNLIDNAIRHGGADPVEVRVGSSNNKLRVQVRDHGPGIKPAHHKKLFQPFFTTEREDGGTGLGLAIVKTIVDSRDGEINVDTGADGTTFTAIV